MANVTAFNQELVRDALAGLSSRPRTLPSKWFYDARGSALFDAICELPEYYPTRTETAILGAHGDAISARLGEGIHLIEFGAGSSLKTRILLRKLIAPASYVPLDISREHLLQNAALLEREFPDLNVRPLVADYTQSFELPNLGVGPRVLFFPGSTLGNFTPEAAQTFLRHATALGDLLLIGIDLVKPLDVLLPAYNDAAGVTAQFNLNMLERLNREAGADFELDQWRHQAIWNAQAERIEMYLIARRVQAVHIAGESLAFEAGDAVCTEFSHKYRLDSFAHLARDAGWKVTNSWTDDRQWFSVQLLQNMTC